MKTPHKHASMIKAWADGAEMQYKTYTGEWDSTCHPSWDSEIEYRVKPEPVKVPYRVGLFRDAISGYYPDLFVMKGCEITAERCPSFVRWLTDWIEVEV